jgi:polyhydroxyalkanoate synthesis regulator phasin
MTDLSASSETTPPPADEAPAPPTPPKRSPGHRGQDVRDTVAELAARAHEISLEAGSKMASALKDVINAAAGITAFAIESARDLVQYMVRRGQMTQEEADKLIREAEAASIKKGRAAPPRVDGAKKPAPSPLPPPPPQRLAPLTIGPPRSAAAKAAPPPPAKPAPQKTKPPAPAAKKVVAAKKAAPKPAKKPNNKK